MATSLEGFVQQIATAYLPHGYWFYVMGYVPEHKDLTAVDEKLLRRYGVRMSKWARARRKQAGFAAVQYLRYRRTFVIMATRGRHVFFEEESAALRDIRKSPIKIGGYSIRVRRGPDGKWHSHVRMDEKHFAGLKAHLLELAVHRRADHLVRAIWSVPFEPYAPVRRQLMNILRAVNRERRKAGYKTLPVEVIPMKRRIVRPFEAERSGPANRQAVRVKQGPGQSS